MKHSIVKICKKLSSTLLINTLLTFIVALFIFEQNFSYKKIDNLNEQKNLIKSISFEQQTDKELAHIKINGTLALLLAKTDQLKQLYKYDFVGKFIIFSQKEYFNDLQLLKEKILYIQKLNDLYFDSKNDPKILEKLQKSLQELNKNLDALYIKNVLYNQQKSSLIAKLTITLLFLSILTTLLYKRKVNLVLSDIAFLTAIHPTSKNYETKTIEADAILVKMNKKNTNTIDKELIDPVTELLNHKGLATIYSKKKNLKPNNYTSLTILEIENFSKENKQYSQEIIQAVLKKVAFTLSLFEQPTDVMARTNFNRFTVILSRPTKEQCFKEIEQIAQSIQEIKFKQPNGEYINVSLNGGFVIKTKNRSLDDAIKEAIQVLNYAKQQDKNMIAQTRDLTDIQI